MSAWRVTLAGACVFAAAAPAAAAPADGVGRSIYLRGVLGSGAPLEARREGAEKARGVAAACVNCTGAAALAAAKAAPSSRPSRPLSVPSAAQGRRRPRHPVCRGHAGRPRAYTDALLARRSAKASIRGQALSYLMPNYALGDTTWPRSSRI